MEKQKLMVMGHPRDPYIDGAQIELVERWKESHLSGDEWRFSYVVKIFRKGKIIGRKGAHSMEAAVIELARALQVSLIDLGNYAGWEVLPYEEIPCDGYCCQPGCPNKATKTYVMKNLFDKTCGFSKPNEVQYPDGPVQCREFCDKHRTRGDCGLDDADANYTVVEEEEGGKA